MAELKELKKVVKDHKVEWFYLGIKMSLLAAVGYILNASMSTRSNLSGSSVHLTRDEEIVLISQDNFSRLMRIEGSKEPISVKDLFDLKDILLDAKAALTEKDSESIIRIDTETLEFHI